MPFSSNSARGDLKKIEQNFCHHYAAHYDPARAAMEAGYRPERAHLIAGTLLRDRRVRQYIAALESDRLRRIKFDGDEFLARELLLATADVSELIETWIPPCRYCWGTNHEYQRTHAEFEEAFEAHQRLPERRLRGVPNFSGGVLVYDDGQRKLPFEERGGPGYDPGQPPNPACPNCRGRGMEDPERGTLPYIRVRDSRELTDIGRMLNAGVRYGKHGVEQLMHDQSGARNRLMSMLGKFLELRATQPAQPGVPALGFGMGLVSGVADLLSDDPRSLSDQQLDALLAQHGVTIEYDGQGGEGASSGADLGEAPPPGRVA